MKRIHWLIFAVLFLGALVATDHYCLSKEYRLILIVGAGISLGKWVSHNS